MRCDGQPRLTSFNAVSWSGSVQIIVVKFDEINLKFKNFVKVRDVIKFEIHIQSQLLAEVTHYCNNVFG